ncbi:MAG TPA: hypothetical protein VHI14_01985 [Jatrophihabitantaceae bacterium]|nr:hypothetical protein [Jatrophihabitantaceae bacterium]
MGSPREGSRRGSVFGIEPDWWDERVPVHAAPNGYYRTERFEADPGFLSSDVRLDQPLLGDIAGLRGIHVGFIEADVYDAPRLVEPGEFRPGVIEPRLGAVPAADM